MATDTYDDLQASYGRCLRNKDFIDRFYEIFLASHDDIPAYFAPTDFRTQRLALRRGISVAISYAGGSGLVQRTFDEMAQVHSRAGRVPVQPELYSYWVDSLLKTIREFDPELTPALNGRWREAMGKTIAAFTQKY